MAPGARHQRRIDEGEVHPAISATGYTVFPTRFPRRLLHSPSLARAAGVAARRADVVHIHLLWGHPQYAGATAARRAGVPYIVSPHGALDPALARRGWARKALTTWVWQRRMLERATLIHVTTEAEGELIADVAPAVPRAVVPVPVDLRPFENLPEPHQFRARFLNGYEGPLILFFGRISYKKGIDVLIDAFALLRRELDCRLAIVGPDDSGLTPSLKARTERAGVLRATVFTGPLFGEERSAALASADVWALPSRTENFGVAVVEAMAAGCPVVISSAVNLADRVAAAGAGIVTDQTPADVAAALRAVLADGAPSQRMGTSGKALARRYSVPAVAAQLERMYLEAVACDRQQRTGV